MEKNRWSIEGDALQKEWLALMVGLRDGTIPKAEYRERSAVYAVLEFKKLMFTTLMS